MTDVQKVMNFDNVPKDGKWYQLLDSIVESYVRFNKDTEEWNSLDFVNGAPVTNAWKEHEDTNRLH